MTASKPLSTPDPRAAPSKPPRARDLVARSIQAAEAGSQHHRLAQAWLNEGGAVGDPERLNPLRILVVEDDGMIATLIAETLQAMGHEVCGIAATEADAVATAALHRPDLLLVDSHLASGSGAAAVAQILLNGPVPHIFMTGDVLTSDGLDRRVTTLRKPFQDHELENAIQRAFAGVATS